MRKEIQLVLVVVLFTGIITECFIYRSIASKVEKVKSTYNESKDEYDRKISEKESLDYTTKVFGYGDILDLLSKELNVRITKFEKNEAMVDSIIVKIEAYIEEQELNRIVSSISEMENFNSIRKISIKSSDKSAVNITIDAEYIINR